MKKLLCGLFILLCAGVSFAQSTVIDIQKRGVLRVGMEAGYAPFESIEDSGEFVGFDVDIAKSFADSLGVLVEFVDTPLDDLFPDLNAGKYDIIISGMTVISERKTQVDFCTPYFAGGQAMLVAKNKAGQIKSFRDINQPNIHIVSKHGTYAADILQAFFRNAKLTLPDTVEDQVLQIVLDGKADVMVYDMPYLALAYAKHKDKLVFIDDPFTYEPFGAAVKKGNTSLRDAMNVHLEKIKANGDYERIFSEWFGGK